MIHFFLSVFLFVFPLSSLAVSVPSWEIIPDESSITFTATQNNAPVTGKFTKFTGDIQVDPNQLKDSHVKIVVDMNSLSTSYQDLTATLITPDWFNTKLFPKAVFVSSQFTKTGDKTYRVDGMLTIRDKSVPVTLILIEDNDSGTKAHVHGSTELKRNDFGVGQGEWAATKEVKDEVKVDFVLSASKKK